MSGQLAQMSPKWLAALEQDNVTIDTYVDVWSSIGGSLLARHLRVSGGSVSITRSGTVRRTCTGLTIPPDVAGLLLPTFGGGGFLYPRGTELQVYKGLLYDDGTSEYAPLGRYLLEGSQVTADQNGVSISASLKDRAQTVSRAQFTSPYSTDGVSTVDVAIKNLLSSQVPQLTQFSFTPSTVVPPVQTWAAGSDPMQAAVTLATAASMVLYFDGLGVCVLQNVIDPNSQVVSASYIAGKNGLSASSIVRPVNISNVPNIVRVVSSGSGVSTPLQTFWWDTNPASATYYAAGPVGPTLPAQDPSATYSKFITTVSTSAATTLAQAQAIANATGLGYLGAIEAMTMMIRDNAAHDIDDVILVQAPTAGLVSPTKFVVDQVAIDLTTNPLSLTCRAVL